MQVAFYGHQRSVDLQSSSLSPDMYRVSNPSLLTMAKNDDASQYSVSQSSGNVVT